MRLPKDKEVDRNLCNNYKDKYLLCVKNTRGILYFSEMISEEIKIPHYVSIVNDMNVFQKLKLYIHYYAVSITLLKQPFFLDLATYRKYTKTPFKKNDQAWGKCDKVLSRNIEVFYCGRTHIGPMAFKEFSHPSNVVSHDNGNEWKERGFAQRYTVRCRGIYNWFEKFGHELNLS